MLFSALIAEDHDITRQGLRSMLENKLEARVVATIGNGIETVSLIEEHNPDLVILDLGLPGLNGLDVLHKIQKRGLSVKIVVLSMHGEDSYVSEAFRKGASAYVLKGAPLSELIDAIRAVMKNETYISDGLSEELITVQTSDGQPMDRYETLTDREREVLQLTAEGHTSREIGEKLFISHRTVEKHRENVQAKLELRNAVEMAAYAHRRGLIQGPAPILETTGEEDPSPANS